MVKIGRFQLRTVVLGIFLPGLLLVTGTLAIWIGNDLSATIVRGFEGKLEVIGAISAAFIDGDEHQRVAGLRQPTGFAFDPERGTLYAANLYSGTVRRFIGNAALPALETGLEGVADLARDPQGGSLYLLSGSVLVALDPATGKTNTVCTLPEEGRGIVFRSAVTNRLVVLTAAALITVDTADGAFRTLTAVEAGTWRGLETTPDGAGLVSIDIGKRQLIGIDMKDGSAVLIADLHPAEGEGLFAFPTFGLARLPASADYLTGTPLGPARIGATNGRFTRYPALPDGQGELYRLFGRYSGPLAAVREKSGLTFLVSCLLVNDYRNIRYIIDSSDDDGYSLTGYVDPTESEEKAADVVIKGKPFISEIKFWEDWGLMKSAYGPIRASDGSIHGMLAADVNIDVIRVKTREALTIVLATGLGALVLAAAAAFYLARRITVPVFRLKNFTLQVAAGDFGKQLELEKTDELAELGDGFNLISRELQTTVEELGTADRLVEAERRRQELRKLLAAAADASLPADDSDPAAFRFADDSADGWARRGGTILVWRVAEPPPEPLARVLLRRRLVLLAERLTDDDWEGRFRKLAGVVSSLVVIDLDARAVIRSGEDAALQLYLGKADGGWESRAPRDGEKTSFAHDGRFLLCGGVRPGWVLPELPIGSSHRMLVATLIGAADPPGFVLLAAGRSG
jgi:HAMP domain-containing protein